MEIEEEIRVNPIPKSSNSSYRLSACVELFELFKNMGQTEMPNSGKILLTGNALEKIKKGIVRSIFKTYILLFQRQ